MVQPKGAASVVSQWDLLLILFWASPSNAWPMFSATLWIVVRVCALPIEMEMFKHLPSTIDGPDLPRAIRGRANLIFDSQAKSSQFKRSEIEVYVNPVYGRFRLAVPSISVQIVLEYVDKVCTVYSDMATGTSSAYARLSRKVSESSHLQYTSCASTLCFMYSAQNRLLAIASIILAPLDCLQDDAF